MRLEIISESGAVYFFLIVPNNYLENFCVFLFVYLFTSYSKA